MIPLYDAHLHFHFDPLVPHHAAIDADLRRIGLQRGVVNGTNEDEWPVIAGLAKKYPWLLPSYGVHPWDCGQRSPDWRGKLRAALAADPRAGVGEIGLDRWIIDGIRPGDPRIAGLRIAPLAEQSEVFAAQLALAAEFNRPASIHATQAHGAVLEILRAAQKLPARGFLLHGYGGPRELLAALTDLGGYFSFNVEWLAPRHAARLENFRVIPADRLLVETDAPTKAPAPERNRFPLGQAEDGTAINHPANLVVAYEALAELRGITIESLAAQVEKNFTRLFLRQASA